MKTYIHSTLICLFLFSSAPGKAQEAKVQIRFDAQVFTLTDVNDQSDLARIKDAPDVIQFYEHFQIEDYQKYRTYYYQENCHATEEDYNNWRAFARDQEIQIVARYLLASAKHTLSIIQYRMGKNGTFIYGPFAQQKINNKWYLFDISQSMDMMQVKGFFTYIKPELIRASFDPSSWTQQPGYQNYVTTGGMIDGKKLLELYPARYDDTHVSNAISQELFYGVSEMDAPTEELMASNFSRLAKEYNVNAKTMELVDNMCREGNFSLAIEMIFQESNAENVIEVTEQLNQIMSGQ